MTKEQRAEALMARGPIQNVRRIMELEDALRYVLERDGQIVQRWRIHLKKLVNL